MRWSSIAAAYPRRRGCQVQPRGRDICWLRGEEGREREARSQWRQRCAGHRLIDNNNDDDDDQE